VTAIEERMDLESLKMDDLVGSFIIYKSSRFQPNKKKNLALRSSKKDEVVVESSNEEFSDSEVMSLETRNFYKF
jgi:RPA family protein